MCAAFADKDWGRRDYKNACKDMMLLSFPSKLFSSLTGEKASNSHFSIHNHCAKESCWIGDHVVQPPSALQFTLYLIEHLVRLDFFRVK